MGVLFILCGSFSFNRFNSELFQADFKAAGFILKHPDYVEGVRARLLDKDDNPQWQPKSIDEVGALPIDL